MSNHLIAPCGINCITCLGYQRSKNKCPGCTSKEANKPKHCNSCIIINCELLAATNSKFCYECIRFPCTRLKQLNKRYSTKYKMSLVENLLNIQKLGIIKYLEMEEIRWRCEICGGIKCVHREFCLNCKANEN